MQPVCNVLAMSLSRLPWLPNAFLRVLALAVALVGATQQLAAATTFYIKSLPGDHVGQGNTYLHDLDTHIFDIELGRSNPEGPVNLMLIHLRPKDKPYLIDWTLWFTAPLAPGFSPQHYEGATRAHFVSPMAPGIDVGGQSRGCNKIEGRFTLIEFEFDENDTVTKLAIDFYQWCDPHIWWGSSAPLYGALRINSDVSIEPRVSLGNTLVRKGNAGTTDSFVTASLSFPSDQAVTATFTTVNGSAAAGEDFEETSGIVEFPPGFTSGPIYVPIKGNSVAKGDTTFNVVLTGSDVALGDEIAEVAITDPNSPISGFFANSEIGDWVGSGDYDQWIINRPWVVTPRDTSMTIMQYYNGREGVFAEFGDPGLWHLSFLPPIGQQLQLGHYEPVERAFSGNPDLAGLEARGNHHGCNTTSGNFTINTLDRNTNGDISKLDVRFRQRCENSPGELYGNLLVNSVLRQFSVANAQVRKPLLRKSISIGGEAVFQVTLNPPSTKRAYIEFSTLDGTALAGKNYLSTKRLLVFEPGQTSATVRIRLLRYKHGTHFFGLISGREIPVWNFYGVARL